MAVFWIGSIRGSGERPLAISLFNISFSNGGAMDHSHDPTRNLALELARVTEAAALAAGRFMGRGDKIAADQAAVNAMRTVLQTVDMNKLAVGPEEKGKINIEKSITDNLKAIAKATKKDVEDLTTIILDRDR